MTITIGKCASSCAQLISKTGYRGYEQVPKLIQPKGFNATVFVATSIRVDRVILRISGYRHVDCTVYGGTL